MDGMANPDRHLVLPDGRRLTYREYGAPQGRPVIYHHGTPSSRVEPEAFGLPAAATAHGVRLIAPDRPGMGGSDHQTSRTLLDWPHDLGRLADHLRLPRFAVLGYSGGVPFAAAAAARLPDRVAAATLAACVAHICPAVTDGLAPDGLRRNELARSRPRTAAILLTLAVRIPAVLAPGLLLDRMSAALPEIDRAVLRTAIMRCGFPAAVREAFRRGSRGPRLDEAVMSGPWGFDPAAMTVPVRLWQGTADTFGARPMMAWHLARTIPQSELHLTGDGHLSILANHVDAILGSAS
jgi:pimeloyl-ACP methyl ester carboxylesterase